MLNLKRLLSITICFTAFAVHAQKPMGEVIEEGLSVSRSQALIMARSLESQEGRFPRSFDKGELITSDYRWWCSGFFPGVLWQLYADKPSNDLRRYAELFTDRAEPVKKMTDTHDLGFMLYCSFGQGYNITGNKRYLDIIKEGTASLLTRFDERLGVIKSWESSRKWKYPVIIDNMMNLEMLCFMTRETNDRQYVRVAETHANKTMENHFRDDYSTFHVVSYDPETGKPHARQTSQGYSDDSAWARGQAWGLYGYTMMYRETLNHRYLEQARHIAHFLCSHPRMPEDGIPYWDFDAPDIPNAPRDASAGAVMASALVELSQLDPSADASVWLRMAEKQLRSLTSPAYLAHVGEQGGFILRHSVGSLPGKSEVDVPLTYADYYYIEALLRMKKLLAQPSPQADRKAWVDALVTIATPVLKNLADETLKNNFPFESLSADPDRSEVSYLEAVGRTICGIAPWLELGPDGTPEGLQRMQMIDLAVRGLKNAVNPQSPDHLRFTANRHRQPLVDAAFLAEGLLRAPKQLWGKLDGVTQQNLIKELRATRSIQPYESNWLLFASIIEAALLEFDGQCDEVRMMHGVEKFRNDWYKGDGWYGDGSDFHLDYYNSLVILPMLTEVLMVCQKHNLRNADFLATQQRRLGRYAEQQERMISPEGTYPVIGRSITYRFGSFHALSDAALLHLLPRHVNPGQVRCAMTAVIKRQLAQRNTFDTCGWLRVGYTGAQIHMSEDYINTGSEYLCCAAFCALGLPQTDPFWSNPYTPWTALKAWSNTDVPADHSINN
ncbi:MAG: DUF2264 domain-containing protein [Bacteroidaceae bacterium]|nr:DUF2264 domain-containing protein [Bacteroidaceae bacterium]